MCVSYRISLCLCEIKIFLFLMFEFAKLPDNSTCHSDRNDRNFWKLNFLNKISHFDFQRTSSGFHGTFYARRHFNNDETHKCQIQRSIFLFITIESRNMDLFNFCLLWSKHCFIFGVSIFTLRMENRYE